MELNLRDTRQGLSIHFKLTLALLCMLAFLFAAGLFGIQALGDAVARLTAASGGNERERAAQIAELIERRNVWQIGLLMLFGTVTVLVVSVLVSRSIRRPLKELRTAADHFSRGELSYRVPILRQDELGEVLETFNAMAAALEGNQQDLSHQAFHDTLTGLPNRSLFHDRLMHALARQERDNKPLAVLLVDLDDFKTVNDSLGHAAGDELLRSVARNLSSCLRPADTAARLGGDEFAVLVEDMRGRRDAQRVAERIINALTGKLVLEGREVFVHGSVGIAITYGGEQADEVMRNADVAMYAAKNKGKGRYQIFDPGMHEGVLARLDLQAELRRAVETKAFSVHYQPTVALDSGRIIGAEALLRWNHPERGFIPPLDFIPLAEETGLILDIGRFVMEEACRQANAWQMGYDPEFRISVNLSGRQLQETNILEEVRRAVQGAPIPADSLTLEITESVLMKDTRATIAKLAELRALGVHIAIDDFGTGYSSLGYLKQFPVEIVKIDKTFTDGIAQGPEDSALGRAIVKLAHTLGMGTVAEGVVEPEQVTQLVALGCTLGQGDLLGKPVPAEDFESLLRTQRTAIEWSEPVAQVTVQEIPEPDPFWS